MKGRDKLLEPVDGVPQILRVARMALDVSDDVTVLLRPGTPDRARVLSGLALDVIEPTAALEGMSGSLRAGFHHLKTRPSPVLLLLSDLPELDTNDLRAVIDAPGAAPDALIWRGATEDGKPGHPILFAPSLFNEFARLKGDGGGKEVVQKAGSRVHLVPLKKSRARLDLDTPGDWTDWRVRTGR